VKKKLLIGMVAIAVASGIYFFERPFRVGKRHIAWPEHAYAPDFSLPDLTGRQLKLSDYRGKVVLLDFWATWCDPCREEIPHFIELQNQYGDRGLQIIGVSMDDGPEPVRDYYQRFQMNYPVVMGNAKIGELYGGVLGLPIAFVIERGGRIYARHIGATDISVFEKEIVSLLQGYIDSNRPGSSQSALRTMDAALSRRELGALERMVRPERFELPTFWFVARRSIQLS
jgi:cytochrome c biogenesis protein CcmG, thiol:disulfide interchange protein DsbE